LLRISLLFIVLGVATALTVAVYVRTTGLSALPAPGTVETRTARFVRGFAVPADVRVRSNPLPASPETIAAGLAHFADHCASCHANDGSGNVTMGRNLYPKSPDMRGDLTQRLTDGELFWIIENGVRFTGMPGWATGTREGEDETWQLVHFIRHLPRLTEDEKTRMASLNPRSPEVIRQELEEERFLQGGTTP